MSTAGDAAIGEELTFEFTHALMTAARAGLKLPDMSAEWPWEDFRDYLIDLMIAAGFPLNSKGEPSRAELARRSGVRNTQLSNWWSGINQPSQENLAKIADVFDVQLINLMVKAGLVAVEELEGPAPDFTVLPRPITELISHWRGARTVEPQFAEEIADRIAQVNEWARLRIAIRDQNPDPKQGKES